MNLKIETEELEHRQTRLKVEVDPALLDQSKQKAAKKLAKRTKIPGFRPGKAPYPVIVRQLGEAVILEEAIELLIDDIYPKVIEESGIEPYGPGSLDEIKSLDPPTFEFIVPLTAKIELGNYRSIRIPYELNEISDEEIESVINNLRNSNAIIEHVYRAIQEGDQIVVNVTAERTDTDEEGTASSSLYKDRPLTLIVESTEETFEQDQPFPGFTNHLIGMSAGDVKKIIHTYPEDYHDEMLRGVEATITAYIEQVNSRELPAIDDELAKIAGDFETLAELKIAIRQQLEEQARESYHEEYDEALLDELVEMSSVAYPTQMLDKEIEIVLDHLSDRLEQQGLDIDLYLKTRGITIEELKEETKPVAENRLKRSLIFYEVANQESIRVDPEELESETVRTMELYSQIMPEQEFRKLAANKETTSGLVSSIMMEMVNDRTREKLRDIARGIETESIESIEQDMTDEIGDKGEVEQDEKEQAEIMSSPKTDMPTPEDTGINE